MSNQGSKEVLSHQPVLYHEIINNIQPSSPGHYIDGTVGAGGHAFGILEASQPSGRLLGLDVDPQALLLASQRLSVFGDRSILLKASFSTMDQQVEQLGWSKVNGILLDLGVSSMQFDTPNRGFSFRVEGPLDMRFNPSNPINASYLVNNLPESELADLIWNFGGEPLSHKIARAIIRSRPLETTTQLAKVVAGTVGSHHNKIHPATRTFQALRIMVNQELKELEDVLPKALRILESNGRFVVLSFHSLEDRMVKQFFHKESRDCICPPDQIMCTCGHKASVKLITHHTIRPTEEEIKQNPRARSARLRVVEKI